MYNATTNFIDLQCPITFPSAAVSNAPASSSANQWQVADDIDWIKVAIISALAQSTFTGQMDENNLQFAKMVNSALTVHATTAPPTVKNPPPSAMLLQTSF